MDYVSYIRGMVGNSEIIMSCAACVIPDERGAILLQKRVGNGLWGLPGGIMELGESLDETAKREVFEETGLNIEIDKLQGVYSKYFAQCANGDKLQPVLAVFIGHIVGGEMKCDEKETLALQYFGKDELPEIFCRSHKDIIEDYFGGKTGCFR